MNITIREFIQTLNAHRVLSNALPSFNLEENYWPQWCFDDQGAHYIKPGLRDDMNYGAMKFEILRRERNLIFDRAEERFYETGKWPLQ
jgi:hypothetical protein